METKIINDIAIVKSNEIIIKDVQSAIDFIMTIKYETNCNKIALNKESITEDFFILSKGLAGEILQKFINYQTKFAIYGDYSKYTSKQLKDFIYLINKLTQRINVNQNFVGILLKITGIAILTEFAVSICNDSGETSIASKIDLGGKIIILSMSVPIITSLLEVLLYLL